MPVLVAKVALCWTFPQERAEKQPLSHQLDFVARILKNIKLKSYPVVIGLTKFDLIGQNSDQSEAPEQLDTSANGVTLSEEEKIVRKIRDYFRQPEFTKKIPKRHEFHVVETSAERNINIKETFKLLAYLIDKTKGKTTKTVEVKSYRDQSKEVDKEPFLDIIFRKLYCQFSSVPKLFKIMPYLDSLL